MQKTLYTLLTMAFLLLVGGCNSIYDDLSECPQGVNFHFYRQTPCESAPSYPAVIKQVRVFAFDQSNVLVEEYSANDIALSADYLLKTPFYQIGKYTFVAWGGEDLSTYNFSAFTKGKTTKQEMLVSIQKQADGKVTTHPLPIYVGETKTPLTIEDRSKLGTIYDLVKINMWELTNRVRFTINGLSKTDTYSITITDDNGVYTIIGDYAPDKRFDYISPVRREGDALKTDFTLMKLAEKRKPGTVVTITNKTTGKVVYTANLIDDIIMYRGQNGEPPYKLECDHDFSVVITLKEDPQVQDTYMLIKAFINDWNAVSRPVIL